MRELIDLTPETVMTAEKHQRFLLKNPKTGQTEVVVCEGEGDPTYFTREACMDREKPAPGESYADTWQHLRAICYFLDAPGDAVMSRARIASLLASGEYTIS